MKNKIYLSVNLFHNISILALCLSFLFLMSSCRVNKTKPDSVNSKQVTSNSNSSVNNISVTSKSKKAKKCFFHDFWESIANPYEDINVDPEEYPEYDYDNQIEFDDIRDQRD